jgi:hypothetical protein
MSRRSVTRSLAPGAFLAGGAALAVRGARELARRQAVVAQRVIGGLMPSRGGALSP